MTFIKGHTPWNKGKEGVMPEPWNKGRKTPLEVREKQRQAKFKNPVKYWLGKKRLHMTDEKHWWWKGDEAKYSAIHMWIRKKLGTATKCEDCGIKGRSRYHWHCINKKYNRNLNNYVQLCPVCHKKRHKIEDSQRKVSKV